MENYNDEYGAEYSVPFASIIEEFKLEVIHIPEGKKVKITRTDVNRPGLALAGFFECFDHNRIQLIGNAEHQYLASLSKKERFYKMEQLAVHNPPAIIVTTGLSIFDEVLEAAKKYGIALARTQEKTSAFQAALIASLNISLAPRITRHGVLVEVYGEGVLITGDSGVGKSEAAIELIKRGHRLIADDAVEIRKISDNSLLGNSPTNIRHFIEVRGIGIIDARRIFGMGAVKLSEKIDMVIQLEPWDSTKAYDRLGLDNEYARILDVKVPAITVPITPGRNLAVIVETAAMNNRQKKMGYNAAKDLMLSLGMDEVQPADKEVDIWQNND